MTKDLLGHRINLFNNLTVYFVGGILLYAYITSSGSSWAACWASSASWPRCCLCWCSPGLSGIDPGGGQDFGRPDRLHGAELHVFGVSGLASKVDTAKLFNSFC